MAETFVMCPECGLRARLAHSQDEVPDPEGNANIGKILPPARF
jgi:hypothetical protein